MDNQDGKHSMNPPGSIPRFSIPPQKLSVTPANSSHGPILIPPNLQLSAKQGAAVTKFFQGTFLMLSVLLLADQRP